MWLEIPHRRSLLQVLFLVILIPGSNSFVFDVLGWVFSAKNAVTGLSYVLSFIKTAIKLFTLLNPTTGVIQVLRGRRESGTQYDILKDTFGSATLNDRMQCLPMILCAIYADPDDFVTPLESKFKKAFRSLFREKYSPVWASQYVRAADIGESSMSAAACQATYPSCTFSPSHLRSLISQAMDVQWYKKNSNEVKT